ncbi:MAG: tRNA-intron lyase [Promethearchaeia archaeon]
MTEKADDSEQSETSEEKKQEKTQIEGNIEKDKVIITDKQGIDEFYHNSYLGILEKENEPEERLLLDPIEVLLLNERKRLLLWKEKDKRELYDFEELLSHFSQFDDRLWQKYVVYMDLRRRGYIVRSGYGEGIEFRVFKRGADFKEDSAKYLIYPIFEGDLVELRDLDNITRIALSSRKDLIFATVNRLSKVVYYNVQKFKL